MDAPNFLCDMRRKAPVTVTINTRGEVGQWPTLHFGTSGSLTRPRADYQAPSGWTGVRPGVLYNNNGCGSGGFEGEHAVTKSSCPIVMMGEDQQY